MTLLIDLNAPDFMEDAALAAEIGAQLPGVKILCGPQSAARPDVIMAVTSSGRPQFAQHLPGLKLVQKLGAGVDGVLRHGDLPASVQIARLQSVEQAHEISEYVLGAILTWQRGFLRQARDRRWAPTAPVGAAQCPVAVLGLGRIGAVVAQDLAARGYPVRGWSRSPKRLEGVECFDGEGGLPHVLTKARFVVSVLPSTPMTRGLFDARGLGLLSPDAVLINVGRGDLVDVRALESALDAGQLQGAVLDVLPQEPWPADDPLWARDDVLITPHVSGWSVMDGVWAVAENYTRLQRGEMPVNLVDRSAGY